MCVCVCVCVCVCASMLTKYYYDSLTISFVCVCLCEPFVNFDVFHSQLYIKVGVDPEQ